jgi:hypothetical protein
VGEYGLLGWKVERLGLADVGGVGKVVTDGPLLGLTVDVKWVPGPVS